MPLLALDWIAAITFYIHAFTFGKRALEIAANPELCHDDNNISYPLFVHAIREIINSLGSYHTRL